MLEIAGITHREKQAIVFWLKRYKEYRLKGLNPRYQGGNRSLLTKEQIKEIKRFLNKTSKTSLKKLTGKELRLHLKTKYKVEYRSNESINQIFYKCGFSFRKPEKCYREASEKEREEWLEMIKKK
ncbi:MAG: winged helix-turn-helix domain-containing protein [Nanoarchaeota archaeon]|nr:winged helix-turn-helix domain-containing protein [Nanoarchaeota archaeon]